MKSLVLASLLTVGSTFFMSGCDLFETAKDVAGIETSVIYFVNGNSVAVNAKVNDEMKYLTSGDVDFFDYEGDDSKLNVSYTISGQIQGSTTLSNDNTHIYVSTDCNSVGYLTHKPSSSSRIQIVNLSGNTLANGDYSAYIDGIQVVNFGDNASHCAITPVPVTNTQGSVVVTRASDGKTWSGTLDKDYSFDVVVLPDNEIAVVPLVGFDDLF